MTFEETKTLKLGDIIVYPNPVTGKIHYRLILKVVGIIKNTEVCLHTHDLVNKSTYEFVTYDLNRWNLLK
jgi:hypothetical protein